MSGAKSCARAALITILGAGGLTSSLLSLPTEAPISVEQVSDKGGLYGQVDLQHPVAFSGTNPQCRSQSLVG